MLWAVLLLHPLCYPHVFGTVVTSDTTRNSIVCDHLIEKKIKHGIRTVVVIRLDSSHEAGVPVNECVDDDAPAPKA